MQCCTAYGTGVGPVGDNFGVACHQLDRADLSSPTPAGGPGAAPAAVQTKPRQSASLRITAVALTRPDSQAVTFVLDVATVNIAIYGIYAIGAHAQERVAHLREVQL